MLKTVTKMLLRAINTCKQPRRYLWREHAGIAAPYFPLSWERKSSTALVTAISEIRVHTLGKENHPSALSAAKRLSMRLAERLSTARCVVLRLVEQRLDAGGLTSHASTAERYSGSFREGSVLQDTALENVKTRTGELAGLLSMGGVRHILIQAGTCLLQSVITQKCSAAKSEELETTDSANIVSSWKKFSAGNSMRGKPSTIRTAIERTIPSKTLNCGLVDSRAVCAWPMSTAPSWWLHDSVSKHSKINFHTVLPKLLASFRVSRVGLILKEA